MVGIPVPMRGNMLAAAHRGRLPKPAGVLGQMSYSATFELDFSSILPAPHPHPHSAVLPHLPLQPLPAFFASHSSINRARDGF